MFTEIEARKGMALAQKEEGGLLIESPQDALDLIATARYEGDFDALIVYKEALPEAFFDLSTRLAGEILQKFTNYGMRFGIVGDFSGYTSKSLRDFIYESNKGGRVAFAASVDEAAGLLGE